jgi:DNA-binding CsgD family transcriptional regulator
MSDGWLAERLGARLWAVAAVAAGIALYVGLEIRAEPDIRAVRLALELFELLPIVLICVGMSRIVKHSRRQQDAQAALMRELDAARVQGQHWRSDARSFIDGLGATMQTQFERWNLSAAEREVALLLIKGMALKEIGLLRATSERTVRAQARTVYAKAGLAGRTGLSAFFLEDLMAPAGDEPPAAARVRPLSRVA